VAAIVINIAGTYDDKAIGQAQRRLEDLKGSADKYATGFAGAFKRAGDKMKEVGDNISSFGRKMTLGVTLPIVGIGVAAVNIQKDFEQSMNALAVMTGAPQTELEKLSDLAKQMGADTVFSAGEAAEAMLELAKAGFNPAQISGGALQSTMALAATEGMGLADAATIVTQAMNAFGIKAKDSASAVDILAAGAVASTASVQDLAGGLKYVGSTAGTMGIPLEDVVTGLSSLSNAGIDGTTAGTSLNRMLLGLAGTTPKAAAAIKDYGLKFYNAEGQVKPMIEIIGQLQDKLGGLTDKQRATALKSIFGVEGMRAANILLDQGAKGYEKLGDAVGKAGVAQELADARMSGTAGAIEQLKGSLETAALAIGEALAPALSKVAGFIKDLADRFTSLSPQAQTIIVVIAAIAAAMGPLLIVIGSVISAIGALSGAMAFLIANPVVLAIIGIVAAIAALVAGVIYAYKNFEGFRNFVTAVWEGIQAAVAYVVDWFQAYVWPILEEIFGYIGVAAEYLGQVIAAAWNAIVPVVQKVAAWFMEYVWPTLDTVFQLIGQALPILWNAYKTYWTLILNGVRIVVDWFMTYVWPTLSRVFGMIGTALGVLWNAYQRYWTLIFDIIKKVVSWVKDTAWPFIRDAFNNMKRGAEILWQGIQSAFNLIKSAVETSINTVIGILRGIGTIVSTVVGYFNSIRQGIVDKFNAAVEFVRGIPGKILSALGNVATTLWSAGSDLIGGLIAGIKARAGEVLSTIASFITDKIPQWVKDRLGISSPSKVMMEIGQWIPAGLAKGIARNAKAVAKATADLAKATTKEARKAAREALREAEKEARDLARRIRQTVRESAQAGLESIKEKAREVISYVEDVIGRIRDFGKLSGFDLGQIDQARKALVDAQEAVTKATKDLSDAQAALDKALEGEDTDKIASARETLAEATQKLADANAASAAAQKRVNETAPNAGSIIADMRKRLSAATEFAEVVRQLSALGLNNASLQEIIGMGPGAGTTIGQALLGPNAAANIAEVNSLEKSLRGIGLAVGDVGAQSQFGMDSTRAAGILDTQVNVAQGGIVINFGDGVTAADRAAISVEVEKAVTAGLRELARELERA
jgi:TP901 family phage tail tape measure protein